MPAIYLFAKSVCVHCPDDCSVVEESQGCARGGEARAGRGQLRPLGRRAPELQRVACQVHHLPTRARIPYCYRIVNSLTIIIS